MCKWKRVKINEIQLTDWRFLERDASVLDSGVETLDDGSYDS